MTTFATARRLASSFVAAAATAAAALLATAANAQTTTTLGASYTTTAMESSAALSTTGGLTLNLGLGFEYLIVGGGGGGGGNIGGGGGAGGVLTNVGGTAPAAVVSGGTAAVTVGSGGAGGSINNRGTSGGSSAVFSVTAAGGGGGFYNASGGTGQTGLNGASGGGGSPSNSGGAGGGSATGGGLGNSGGSGVNTGANGYRAGGGGGAGSVGAPASSTVKGDGGTGFASSITDASTLTLYAAGGGGGTDRGDNQGTGGSGIGGNGGSATSLAATAGTANTGSGGGGGGYNGGVGAVAGGAGGSGVVIVRYRSASSLTSGGDTSGSYNDGSDDWQYEQFTSSGTLGVTVTDPSNLLATQTGVISGSGSLTYSGPGTLRLTAANTFTGNTRVAGGTLALANVLALQNSVLDLATADAGTVAFTVPGSNTYTLKGLSGSRALDIGGNALSLGGTATTSSYSGDLSGTGGSLTKTGTGTLTLSGTSSYSGGTTIEADGGILVAGSATAFGTGTVSVNGTNATPSMLDVNGQTLANDITIQFKNTGDLSDTGVLKNTNTATAAVLNGALSIGGENYVGGDGDITINGIVAGGTTSYSFFKQGGGTWTFANEANTFDGLYYQVGGVTEVTKLANAGQTSSLGQVSAGQNRFVFGFGGSTGGTLRYIGSAASSTDRAFSLDGTSNIFDMSGTTAGADLEITGVVSGGGTLTKSGVRTLTLAGTNTYTGSTTISAGTLEITGVLGSGSYSNSISNAGSLVVNSASNQTLSGAISGAGSLTKDNTGTITLSGNSSFSGGVNLAHGTLTLGSANAIGSSGTISFGGGILQYSGSNNTDYSSRFSTAASQQVRIDTAGRDVTFASNLTSTGGTLEKLGTGTLTLSGTNTYSGGTSLAAGTILVTTNTALGSGSVTYATAGATLNIASDISNDLAVDANGTLVAGATNVELSGNLTGSGTLTKTGTGTLTLSGSASTFTGDLVISGGSGANSIVKAGSANAFGSGTVTILGGGSNTGSTFDLNGFSLDNGLVIGQGNSGVGSLGALQNNGPTPAVLNGPVSSGGEIYVGGSGNITFNGVVSGGVNPSNAYSFYKDGSSTWTFANTANTFDGFYYLIDGATEVASLANLNEPSSLGQPTDANRNRLVFGFNGSGGGTLRFNGSAASTSDRVFVMAGSTASADNTIEAAGTSAAATLTLTGGLSANRAASYTARLAGDNAGINEYAGVIANGSGTVALEKTGTTTWALGGTNTYTGATTVSAGTLKVGNGSTAGTLGGGAVSVAAGATMAFDRTDAGLAVANVISGNGSVVQAGSGTTTLSGANTFTGGTTISAGTLAVSAIADAGTSNLGTSGTLALAGGTLEYTAAGNATTARLVDISAANTTSAISVSDAAATLTLTNNVRNSDPTHPNVVLTKTGSGTLEIAGAGGNTGTSLVAAAGTTLLNATERAVYEIRALDTGATVRLAQANQVFNGDAISTTGNIRMTGGTLDLDGNAQEIFRLIGSGNATAGTGTITSSTAATFTVGNNLAGRPSLFDGSIAGDVAVVTRGTNPITLGGASSYTGTTTVGGSRLSVNGSLGNTAVTVTAGTLGGSGSIAGSVTVQTGGTLAPGNSVSSFATGATTFDSGATFAYEVDSTNLASLGTAADLLVVDGNLSITAGSLLSFADLNQTPQPFVEDSTVFAMINYTGTWDGGQFTYGGQPLADGSRFTVGSQMWEIDYDYAYNGSNTQPLNFSGDFLPVSGTQTFVTVTAVPEPSTYLMLVIAAGMGAIAARRRRTAQA